MEKEGVCHDDQYFTGGSGGGRAREAAGRRMTNESDYREAKSQLNDEMDYAHNDTSSFICFF